jgi:DMSO reductase anchor subunit
LLAGDHAQSRPSDPHLPLVFMLVMTQLAIGTSVAAMFVQTKAYTLASAAAGALAVGIGTLHLGQPLKAWRAFLGWRKSWFSREVIAFGGFVGLASLNAASFWFTPLASFRSTLAIATAGVGVLGVICSAMIYVDTHREFWNARSSFGRFLGTTTLLGTATSVALVVFTPTTSALGLNVLAGLLIFVTVLKLTGEHRIFRHLICEETPVQTPLNKTARLLDGELGLVARSRVACGLLGGLAFPTLILFGGEPIGFAISSFAFCTAGELLERYLFFTAVLPVKMPGAPAPPIARTGAARFRSKSEFRIPQFADSEAASRPRQQGRGVTRRSLPERR